MSDIIVEAVQTYLDGYAPLTGKKIWINFLGAMAPQYSIVPLPADDVIEEYLSGSSERQFVFALQSVQMTADDGQRLAASGFYEGLSKWFEEQTKLKNLPDLGEGRTATEIQATTSGFLMAQEGGTTGIYQIQCRLLYYQSA